MHVNKFKYLCGEEGVYGERRGIWKIYLSSTEVYDFTWVVNKEFWKFPEFYSTLFPLDFVLKLTVCCVLRLESRNRGACASAVPVCHPHH